MPEMLQPRRRANWPTGLDRAVDWDGQRMDREVIPLVNELTRWGFHTTESCAGHEGRNAGPYVRFWTDDWLLLGHLLHAIRRCSFYTDQDEWRLSILVADSRYDVRLRVAVFAPLSAELMRGLQRDLAAMAAALAQGPPWRLGG